jgi:antiviral helicase SKI2
MSGRAGRRGLDEKGTVIVFINDIKRLPEKEDFKNMVDNPG